MGGALNALLGAMLLPLFGVAAVPGPLEVLDVVAFLPFLFVVLLSVDGYGLARPRRRRRHRQAHDAGALPVGALRRIALGTVLAFVAATLVAATVAASPYALAGLLVAPLVVEALVRYTRTELPAASVGAMVGLAFVMTGAVLVALLAGGSA